MRRMSSCLNSYFSSLTKENIWEWEYVRNSKDNKEYKKYLNKFVYSLLYLILSLEENN